MNYASETFFVCLGRYNKSFTLKNKTWMFSDKLWKINRERRVNRERINKQSFTHVFKLNNNCAEDWKMEYK